ncbi:MAG TPA: branched-chain amino acid ABC transporter substrate-binding protein [Allosphingosinicella sp.]|nr:branched-chain amino acid ABC transporter substrate-binding protein [Allosphingosinicella sp.]
MTSLFPVLATALGLALATPPAVAEIVVGVAGAMTGPNAWLGEQQQRGAEMAVSDLNAAGGVLGEQVRLSVVDDACEVEQAVPAAEKLVSGAITVVVGHLCSGASIAASKIYAAAGLLQITPASTNPQLTELGYSNVFRVCGRDDQQGLVAGSHLADRWAGKRIAILHDGSVYGKGLAEETRKELNRRGVIEALYDAYEPDQQDYLAVVAKLAAAKIDVLYVGGYLTGAGLILRAAHDQGHPLRLVAGDALASEDFWLVAGPAGEGAMFTFAPDARDNPAARPVVERFRSEGFEPAGYTLAAYSAVQVWAMAAERARSLEAGAVARSLREHEFDLVSGKVGFDAKGDLKEPTFTWYIWRNGQYVPAE